MAAAVTVDAAELVSAASCSASAALLLLPLPSRAPISELAGGRWCDQGSAADPTAKSEMGDGSCKQGRLQAHFDAKARHEGITAAAQPSQPTHASCAVPQGRQQTVQSFAGQQR